MPAKRHWQLEEHDFWNFSLQLYAHKQVMDNCLFLQDNANLNVNIILFCCFAEQIDLPIDLSFLTVLNNAADKTEAQIQTHRAQRKQYKLQASVNQGEMFDPEHYNLLKQQELSLEKQQQNALIDAAKAHTAQIPLNALNTLDSPIDTAFDSPIDNNSIASPLSLELYAQHFANVQGELSLSAMMTSIRTTNQFIKTDQNRTDHYAASK